MEIKKIKLDDVLFQEVVLRSHKETENHISDLCDDLEERGLLNLMSLIPSNEEEGKYITTDGARRMTALKRMKTEGRLPKGIETLDSMFFVVRDAQEELDTLSDMVAGNANIKKTTNTQFIEAIYRIATETDISMSSLAKKVGMTEEYIGRLFKTLKLGDEVLAKAQEKEVSIANLITLAKLAGKVEDDVMDEWLDKASDIVSKDFVKEIAEKLGEIRDELKGKEGKAEQGFVLTPKFIGANSLSMLLVQCESAFGQDSNITTETRYNLMQEIYQIDEPTAQARERMHESKQEEKRKNTEKRKQARENASLEETKKQLEDQGYTVTNPTVTN